MEPDRMPGGRAAKLLKTAATIELVLHTDGRVFPSGVQALEALEPDLRFVAGERPLEADHVYVFTPDPTTVYLSCLRPRGGGLYVRLDHRAVGPPKRSFATDANCGRADALAYHEFDRWPR
jgi:hypothetical protein